MDYRRHRHPLLDTAINGKDHLEIRAALEMIGEVLTRHQTREAFDDEAFDN